MKKLQSCIKSQVKAKIAGIKALEGTSELMVPTVISVLKRDSNSRLQQINCKFTDLEYFKWKYSKRFKLVLS
jgi:hypothetical protein